VKTPVRAPKANTIAERFVRTVRAECLDWLLVVNPRHLERVLRVFADHYKYAQATPLAAASAARAAHLEGPHHRPALSSRILPGQGPTTVSVSIIFMHSLDVERRERLGGLIHEYSYVA
jgi:hypothetical protein